MTGRPLLVTLIGLALACAGPYAERPPASPGREAPPPTAEAEPPGEAEPGPPVADPADETIVGHVTPDGRFHADTIPVATEPFPVERRTVVTGNVRTAAAAPATVPTATGFRVQVFAARDHSTAAEVARRLEARLGDSPVYVEHDDSWYKVRVGDFATREEAEPLRERLIGLGYAEAWTTRTTIQTAR